MSSLTRCLSSVHNKIIIHSDDITEEYCVANIFTHMAECEETDSCSGCSLQWQLRTVKCQLAPSPLVSIN